MDFDYSLDFKKVNFRQQPELYHVGRGEQGVLLVEPYKSELLPHWRFRTPELAQKSGETIFGMFLEYLEKQDFVGADMARKFLQMGYTRSRRYANHPSGRKYKTKPTAPDQQAQEALSLSYPYSSGSPHKQNGVEPQASDAMTSEKAQSARIFKEYWDRARNTPAYIQQKARHKELYEKPVP